MEFIVYCTESETLNGLGLGLENCCKYISCLLS